MKTTQKFEDFLKDKHGEEYHGTDDNMRDDYENWLSCLDIDEIIEYAECWRIYLLKK